MKSIFLFAASMSFLFLLPQSASAYIDPNAGGFFFQTVAPFIYGLLGFSIIVVPFWMIFSKAGYSGWRSLLNIIPIVGIIHLFWFAFTTWPIQKDINNLKKISTTDGSR